LTRAEYRNILACLHPDPPEGFSKERKTEAFRLFTAIEGMVVKKGDRPPPPKETPITREDLVAMKRAKQVQRKDKPAAGKKPPQARAELATPDEAKPKKGDRA
jgi:hypothetical protein